jgi:tagaturonate reductase
MKRLNKEIVAKPKLTEKVLQYGEGNFLRAFVDYMINKLNAAGKFNGSIVLVQPINSNSFVLDKLREQDELYTVILRGMLGGEKVNESSVVTSVSRGINPFTDYGAYIACAANPDLRFIVSNTTEAGIAYHAGDKLDDKPQHSFPGKVTAFLYERWKAFDGDKTKGFVFLPCELIDENGTALRKIVLQYAEEWGLGADFIDWVITANYFTNTLVDRIVTGYPKDEAEGLCQSFGYVDELIDTAEIFHYWAVEYPDMPGADKLSAELPLHEIGLNVVWEKDIVPYKARKVRILNGAHTASVLAAYLSGKETVGEMMDDAEFDKYLRELLFDEVIPTITQYLPFENLKTFADSVFDRFRNPYIRHYILSIALNSVSKYRARVLPSILEYVKIKGELPRNLTFSMAALIAFYKGGENYAPQDDAPVLEFFKSVWGGCNGSEESVKVLVGKVLGNTEFWGQDLNGIAGFAEKVSANLYGILTQGAYAALLSR